MCVSQSVLFFGIDMTDQVIDYRRIAVKGITALEQIGRFTIRVFVQVRQPPLPPSYMLHYSTRVLEMYCGYLAYGKMLPLWRLTLI